MSDIDLDVIYNDLIMAINRTGEPTCDETGPYPPTRNLTAWARSYAPALISAVRERDERIAGLERALADKLTQDAQELGLYDTGNAIRHYEAVAYPENATAKAESWQHMPDVNEKGKKRDV